MIEAVVFDLDGVLIESEEVWDDVRRRWVADHGGHWRPEATRAMQGMSAPEWSAYVRGELGVDLGEREINAGIVAAVAARYQAELPLLPGALGAVERLRAVWRLGLASSSDRVLIDEVLRVTGLAAAFAATVSSEEVDRGKPAPDVYLRVARHLGASPSACAAVEDSTNGIRSAHAAGLLVIAIPNRTYPPAPEALAVADAVLGGLDELTEGAIRRLDDAREARIDAEEVESFPASDPHSDWSG
ncbi:MAG: HAD family hydrolase [Acidimicrobiales bacterium]